MREQQIGFAELEKIMVAKEKCRYNKERCLTTYVRRKEGEGEEEEQTDAYRGEEAVDEEEIEKTISNKVSI